MERSLKELGQKKEELEQRCAKLEVENRFLKDLLTEKEGNRRERRGAGKAKAKEGVWEDEEMREADDRKDGVGTA